MQGLWGKAVSAARGLKDYLLRAFLFLIRLIFGTVPDYILSRHVQRWHTSMRGWKGDDVRVVVDCTSEPWHWALADWLWNWQTWVCHGLGWVPLPDIITGIRGHWDGDEPGYTSTLGEWYGDSAGDLWHVYICNPLFQWTWSHLVGGHVVSFELTLEEARKKFAHDPGQYEWVEKEIARNEKWDAEQDGFRCLKSP